MSGWAADPERGAGWLVRLMLWLIRYTAPFARYVVLPGISLWFFAASPAARAASAEFLGAALGRPARRREVLAHIHSFALTLLDRALMLTGGTMPRLDVTGLEHVQALAARGQGCLLLGAHLGSFAVLQRLAADCNAPVRMLMWQRNAGPFTRAMLALDPRGAAGVIPIGDVHSMLRVAEAVAAGSMVGVLADRVPGAARQVGAQFLGRPAAFPAGPFVLAASLGVPCVLFSAVRTGRDAYRVAFTPFAERVVLRRASRQDDLAAVVARYAAWLEALCRAHPFAWFNFFPFWERPAHEPTRPRPLVAAGRPAGRRPPGHAVLGPRRCCRSAAR